MKYLTHFFGSSVHILRTVFKGRHCLFGYETIWQKQCTTHLYFPLHFLEWYFGTQITFEVPIIIYERETLGKNK
jgi:hypothetical protein